MSPAPGSVTIPRCPICSESLQLGSQGELDRWSCPAGHGLAMTLSESYGRLQEDEIALLWQTARRAPVGPLTSPFGGPMVRFSFGYDDDEIPEGEPGDGPDLGTVEVDVDLEHQFIWFDAEELEQLPLDLPNTPPSAEVLQREAEIRAQFGAGIDDALAARDDGELSERLYQRLARSPSTLRALDRVGRAVTTY